MNVKYIFIIPLFFLMLIPISVHGFTVSDLVRCKYMSDGGGDLNNYEHWANGGMVTYSASFYVQKLYNNYKKCITNKPSFPTYCDPSIISAILKGGDGNCAGETGSGDGIRNAIKNADGENFRDIYNADKKKQRILERAILASFMLYYGFEKQGRKLGDVLDCTQASHRESVEKNLCRYGIYYSLSKANFYQSNNLNYLLVRDNRQCTKKYDTCGVAFDPRC